MTILMIEDSLEILDNTTELLEIEGYSTLKATNGALGVDLAIQNAPDLIITDIVMPKYDGYYVLKELSVNETTQHIPIIFCTGLSEPKEKLKGMALGADDYIVKPYKSDDLLDAINRCFMKKMHLEKEEQEVVLKRRYEVVTSLTA